MVKIPNLTDPERSALYELKHRLAEVVGKDLVRFVIYGSRARGDSDEDADLDVAVVVKGLTHRRKHRILDLVAEIEINHVTPLSTLVLSYEDFELLKERERRIALDIEEEGIAL